MSRRCVWLCLFLFVVACGSENDGRAQAPTASPTPTATSSPVSTPAGSPASTPIDLFTRTPTASPTPAVRPKSSAEFLSTGPYGVGVTHFDLVDSSRPTRPNGSFPGAPERTLPTEVWYPATTDGTEPRAGARDAELDRSGAPYPLVVYSHGFFSERFEGLYLTRHLASHGYVVLSADFPLSNRNAPGGATVADAGEQPADVRFLVDTMLGWNADESSPFFGAVDPERIGFTGLSLGGLTTYLAAFHPEKRDPRVRAAAPIAGPGCFFSEAFFERTLPLLVLHGDIDAFVPWEENARRAFDLASPPKYLVTVRGGSHAGFADAVAQLFGNLPNPDVLGCQAVDLPSEGEEEGLEFLESLGGPEDGIVANPDCPAACQFDSLPPAIPASRQVELAILSVFPFFEAYLRDDDAAEAFLKERLAAENPELSVEWVLSP